MSDLVQKTALEKVTILTAVTNPADSLNILNQFNYGRNPSETLGWMIATAVWHYWRSDNGLSARNSAVIEAVESIRRFLERMSDYQKDDEIQKIIVFYNENIAEIFTRPWYVPSDYRRVGAWTI